MTRDFTILFYKCHKTGSALYKHYKVYKRPTCGWCNGQITVCRLGENSRMTYFCSQCQKEDPRQVVISELPTRNSLISWAYGGRSHSVDYVAKKEEEEWSCALCTLINKPSTKSCDACWSPRPEAPSFDSFGELPAFNNDLVKYPCNNFGKPPVELKINRKTAFGTTTLVLTDVGNKLSQPKCEDSSPLSEKGSKRFMKPSSQCSSLNCSDIQTSTWLWENSTCSNSADSLHTMNRTSSLGSFSHIPKKLKTEHLPSSLKTNKSSTREPHVNFTDGSASLNPGNPRCKHNRPCTLRVVRKDGENKGRQFFACSLPREIQCEFFEWADLHFPVCNHGKRCLVRTVLKIGPNNGWNFYVCPLAKEKQCEFFQWAENGPGIKITLGF
uniref:Nei like DNA glycosylase 3 n=2 Tax=Latimeria chalumnae TaxID=7897 RepID=H2ZSG9_LATCH